MTEGLEDDRGIHQLNHIAMKLHGLLFYFMNIAYEWDFPRHDTHLSPSRSTSALLTTSSTRGFPSCDTMTAMTCFADVQSLAFTFCNAYLRSVSTNTEIDFIGIWVFLVRYSNLHNG